MRILRSGSKDDLRGASSADDWVDMLRILHPKTETLLVFVA